MKDNIENILKAIYQLPDNSREYVIRQLRGVISDYNNKVSRLELINSKNNNINPNEYTEYLQLTLDILKLHGYQLADLITYRTEFLNWFTKNTSNLNKYKAKEINKTILDSFNQGYQIFKIEFDREPSDYKELRDFVMNWEQVLKDHHKNKLNTVLNGTY